MMPTSYYLSLNWACHRWLSCIFHIFYVKMFHNIFFHATPVVHWWLDSLKKVDLWYHLRTISLIQLQYNEKILHELILLFLLKKTQLFPELFPTKKCKINSICITVKIFCCYCGILL